MSNNVVSLSRVGGDIKQRMLEYLYEWVTQEGGDTQILARELGSGIFGDKTPSPSLLEYHVTKCIPAINHRLSLDNSTPLRVVSTPTPQGLAIGKIQWGETRPVLDMRPIKTSPHRPNYGEAQERIATVLRERLKKRAFDKLRTLNAQSRKASVVSIHHDSGHHREDTGVGPQHPGMNRRED